MARWYDQHLKLAQRLDKFETMDQKQRDQLVKGVMNLLKMQDPNLLSTDNVFDFPLSFSRLRWYDSDPYLWFMFNTLKIASDELLLNVEHYLENEMDNKVIK